MMYMILWFNHNAMDVVNVVMFYLVSVSDTTNDFSLEINIIELN